MSNKKPLFLTPMFVYTGLLQHIPNIYLSSSIQTKNPTNVGLDGEDYTII